MNYHLEILEIFYKFKNLHFITILPDNLTHGQCFIMMKIKENKNITFSHLASELHISVQSLSRTIKQLEKMGYVDRFEDKLDRRNNFLKLSKKGNNVVNEVKKNMEEYCKNIYNQLGEKRFNDFIMCLNDLYDISSKEINKIKIKE